MHQGSLSGGSDDGCKLQVKAYAKVDAELPETHSGCTPVMVSITAPSGMAKRRAPVDAVLVLHVHVRYMAPANWHRLLVDATKLIVGKLDENDRLAVVPSLLKETRIIFEDAVIVPVKPKLLLMSDENKAAASNSVDSSKAMRSNTPLLRDLETAESILYGRGSNDKEKRAGYIIVISNSDEDMTSVHTWRFRSVHAFGFRDAQNARTMYTIARNGESTCAVLDEEDGGITESFTASIDKITSAAEPVEVKLKCKKEVILSAISAPRVSYFISYDKKIGIIWAKASRAGMVTNFIVYLKILGDYRDKEYGDLLNIQVKYGRPPDAIEPKVLPLVPVRKGMNGSQELAAEVVRMEAVKIVADITAETKNDHNYAYADMLCERWSRLVEESNYGREAAEAGLISGLTAEIQEMQKRLRGNQLWLEYMLSWRSHQWWPRPPLIMDKKKALSDTPRIELVTTTKNPLLRLRMLAKVDTLPAPIQKPELGLPVLVQITVPVEGLDEDKRVPLDLVAVLDVSCGGNEMMEKKLTLLNKAMGFLMERLSHKDRLAIIPVQCPITEPGLLQITIEGRRQYTDALSVLTWASEDAQQISRRKEQIEKATCLSVATVNSSETTVRGSNKLSKSLKDAVELLDDRQADGKDRMGLIIVISDNDDISIRWRTLSSIYAIHTFSFHDADNARAMHGIARCSNGFYALVADSLNEISEAFMACIRKITSTIAVNTKVNIVCSRSSRVKLSTIESGHFKFSIDRHRKSGSIFAGALYPGAARRFLIYLKNVREDDYDNLYKMLAVNVTWQHAPNRMEEQLHGRVVTIRGKRSKEVVEEIVRVEGMKIVSAITDPEAEIDSVLDRVQELRERLKVRAVYVGVRPKASSYAMVVDEESIPTLVNGSSLSYMLSWLSFQGLCEKPLSAPVPAPSMPRRETGEIFLAAAPSPYSINSRRQNIIGL